MVAKASEKSVLAAAFPSPPCEYCELARAIQPNQENKSSPPGSEKGTILLGPTSVEALSWNSRSLSVANHFGLRREQSLRDLLEDAPMSRPPEKGSPNCLNCESSGRCAPVCSWRRLMLTPSPSITRKLLRFFSSTVRATTSTGGCNLFTDPPPSGETAVDRRCRPGFRCANSTTPRLVIRQNEDS